MNEINSRWLRDHRRLLRLTSAGVVSAAALWVLSFFASYPAAFSATAHEAWFGAASIVTFVGAVGLTIASGVGVSALISDDPPLSGDNQ